jgi:hypothetical protein
MQAVLVGKLTAARLLLHASPQRRPAMPLAVG